LTLQEALTIRHTEISAENAEARKLVYDAAIAGLVSVGFEESRAKHVLAGNAAILQGISNPRLTMDQAEHLEAAATVLRFGKW